MSKDFYIMVRGWMDDDVFSNEPYTEREAFLYLIEKSAWKIRRYRSGNKVVQLKRGQFTGSLRYIAKAWQWKKDKVASFLKILVSADMIKTEQQTRQTVITICNYSKFQDIHNKVQTDTRQILDSGQTADRQRTDKNNQDNQDNQDIKDNNDFEKWWKVYPRKVGKGSTRKCFDKAIKKIKVDDLMVITNQYNQTMNGTEMQFIPHPTTWLNQERWLDDAEPVKKSKPDWMI